jgi:molybdopterin molybdotransferase
MAAAAWSVWLDVPAQPVAAWVCFAMFIRPALLRLMGAYPQATPLLQARSSEILRKKPGHTQYQLGTVFTAPDGNLQVCTTSVQGSDQISSLARANGLIVLRHEQGDVTAGDVVEILMFDTTL